MAGESNHIFSGSTGYLTDATRTHSLGPTRIGLILGMDNELRLTRLLRKRGAQVMAAARGVAHDLVGGSKQGCGEPYRLVAMARAMDAALASWTARVDDLHAKLATSYGVWDLQLATLAERGLERVDLVDRWDINITHIRTFGLVPWVDAGDVRKRFEALAATPDGDIEVAIRAADGALKGLLAHRRNTSVGMRMFSGWDGSTSVRGDSIEAFQECSEQLAERGEDDAYRDALDALEATLGAIEALNQELDRHQRALCEVAATGLRCLHSMRDGHCDSLDRIEAALGSIDAGVVN